MLPACVVIFDVAHVITYLIIVNCSQQARDELIALIEHPHYTEGFLPTFIPSHILQLKYNGLLQAHEELLGRIIKFRQGLNITTSFYSIGRTEQESNTGPVTLEARRNSFMLSHDIAQLQIAVKAFQKLVRDVERIHDSFAKRAECFRSRDIRMILAKVNSDAERLERLIDARQVDLEKTNQTVWDADNLSFGHEDLQKTDLQPRRPLCRRTFPHGYALGQYGYALLPSWNVCGSECLIEPPTGRSLTRCRPSSA